MNHVTDRNQSLKSIRHARHPVVILAGGLAKRLGDLTRDQPKCLVNVAGEPFLFHQLRLLSAQGVTQVTLCLGHLGEQVVQAAGNGASFGLEIQYAFDGPTLVGTAGAIRSALSQLTEQFFVLYGDSYLPCDFQSIQQAFQESDKLALMTVYRNEQQWDTSNVEFQAGQILAYDKVNRTERMRHIDYGLGVFCKSVFEQIPAGQSCDLATIYQNLLTHNQLAAYEVAERFYEVGSHAGLEETRMHLSRHATSKNSLEGIEAARGCDWTSGTSKH